MYANSYSEFCTRIQYLFAYKIQSKGTPFRKTLGSTIGIFFHIVPAVYVISPYCFSTTDCQYNLENTFNSHSSFVVVVLYAAADKFSIQEEVQTGPQDLGATNTTVSNPNADHGATSPTLPDP